MSDTDRMIRRDRARSSHVYGGAGKGDVRLLNEAFHKDARMYGELAGTVVVNDAGAE